ncbi:MAG: hypothetical protein K2N83_00485 [Eubacterium sp.]|nr:hypothetical protein [Eubacterium sp.]
MKNYVEVTAVFDTDGNIIPKEIKIEDSRYEVDRVMDIRPAASLKSGGAGIRYKCMIEGRETYLFLEETRWFLELAQ